MTMIVRRLGVGVVSAAILAGSLTGCGSGSGSRAASGSGCTAIEFDFAANPHGQATPGAALATLLHRRSLPTTGWQRHDTAKDQVVYRSGSSRVTVFQVADASWLVDSYSFCG